MIKFISIIFILQLYAFADDKIPIPNKQVPYDKKDIITNPVTGEKLVYNQMLVVFDPSVNRQRQEKILDDIDGEVVGGLPSFDIYQITFNNTQKSFSKLAETQLMLEKNKKIIFAMPQKVDNNSTNITKKLVSSTTSEREGRLNSSTITRKITNQRKNSFADVINGHYSGLYACVEKQNRLVNNYHGTIKFELIVNPAGAVINANVVKSSVRDKLVTMCMLKKIRRWVDFPKNFGTEDKRVEFDFKF